MLTLPLYYFLREQKTPFALDTKGALADLSSKADCFAGWSTLLKTGCCDVIEPVLSVTLDSY
jgi:hypothetical protein